MKNDDRKRLPGSEKLTRPEDLKSLSKYLGNIRKTQEEHVKLDESTLEVPGVTTGYIPEINTLPDSIENLEDGRAISLSDEVENLPESQIKLDDKEQPSALLDQTRIDLRQDKEVVALIDSRVIGLSATDSIESLPDPIEELSVSDDIELTDARINIEPPSTPADLSNTIIQGISGDGVNVDGLESSRKDLTISPDPDLSNSMVGLKNVGLEDSLSLSEYLDLLGDKNSDQELETERLNIEVKEDKDLANYKEVLSGELDTIDELGNFKVGIDLTSDTNALETKVVRGQGEVNVDIPLSEDIKRLQGEEKIDNLQDTRLNLEDDIEISGLTDSNLGVPENTDHPEWSGELYDTVLETPESIKKEYTELLRASDLTKYTKILEMADNMGNWGSKIASFVSSYLSGDSISEKDAIEFDNKLKDLLSQLGYLKRVYDSSSLLAQSFEEIPEVSDLSGERSGNIFDRYKRNSKVSTPEAENKETYISGSGDPREESEYTPAQKLLELYKNPYNKDENKSGYPTIPTYKLPVRGVLDALNVSDYLRYVAESSFVKWDPKTMAERKIKETLLNETLALLFLGREQLERLNKSNRDRLPGDDFGMLSDLMSSGVSGAAENLKDNALSAIQNTFAGAAGIDKTNPLNRPKKNMFTGEREYTKEFELGNYRQDAVDTGLAKNLGINLTRALIGNIADKALGLNKYDFKDNYLVGTGILKTLEDLCNFTDTESMSSVEELFQLLRDSEYISTPRQFGTLDKGNYGTMTLDTNSYWEITMTPFCNTIMNGGYSFLPAIEEMNIINNATHGISTRYSKWIPAINFELQKSKVTSKSLGLFDGEIVYPTSAELVNEFRMTLVDDQYKSWRNYFQKCADVSVYSSEAHFFDYYQNTIDYSLKNNDLEYRRLYGLNSRKPTDYPTIVDKTKPIAAYYKNITFEIKVYIMTPQYSTIRKFDLLCVLRDFQEEFSGDIDSGGYDLTLNFSIVGENPIAGLEQERFLAQPPMTKSMKELTKNLKETQSNLGRPRNSLIKLL